MMVGLLRLKQSVRVISEIKASSIHFLTLIAFLLGWCCLEKHVISVLTRLVTTFLKHCIFLFFFCPGKVLISYADLCLLGLKVCTLCLLQRIQYAKTKSDIIAKADGTFVPREKRKRHDDRGKASFYASFDISKGKA